MVEKNFDENEEDEKVEENKGNSRKGWLLCCRNIHVPIKSWPRIVDWMDCLTTQITPLLARGNKTSHFHIIMFPRHSIEMTVGAASRTPESLTGCCCRGCRCSLLTCLDFHTSSSICDTLRSDKRTASFLPFATQLQRCSITL